MDKHTDHTKFALYFLDKKCTSGCCFVFCYYIVADDVNKLVFMEMSRKQHPLIKTALTVFQRTWCRIFLLTRQTWYRLNALHTQNSELAWKLCMVSSRHE